MSYWKHVEEEINNFITEPGDEVHMGKKHIFIDRDLSDYAENFEENCRFEGFSQYIGPSHRIHIFFARPNKCIMNNKLYDFIEECGEVTNRRVIIHVPVNRPLLAKLIKGTVYGLENCMVIEEDPDKTSLFTNKSDTSSIQSVTVGWNMEKGE